MSNSYDALKTRELMSKGVVARVTSDTGIAIRLKFIGNGTDTITSVTTTAATDITIDWGTAADTVYDFVTYDTVGKLVDKINSDGYFEAKVLDSLRSLPTASQFVNGAITASHEKGYYFYDVLVDSSEAKYLAYRISPNRLMLKGKEVVADKHRTHLLDFVYLANVNAATADSVQIWDIDSTGKFETKLWSGDSVDNTATTINFNSPYSKLTSLGNGHELLVIVKDATSLADAGYLIVSGEIE